MALSMEMEYLMNSLSCVTHNGSRDSLINIEEKDQSAKLNKVKIIVPNGDWFCFSPDEGRKCARLKKKANLILMSPLLKVTSEFSHHCACDAVIFYRKNNELNIIYIDLKSGNPIGYASQFKSTRQFVRYLLALSEEFTGRKVAINAERYIVFYGGNRPILNKKTTIPKKRIVQSKPDNAYKREIQNGATLHFRELLA